MVNTSECTGHFCWWLQMSSSGQAAWVQGIVSIFALAVAVFVPIWQRKQDKQESSSRERRVVMSAAADLEVALSYEAIVTEFAPAGDGVIGHDDLTLEGAVTFMSLRPETVEALKVASEKSHYFDDETCEKIVTLRIKAAAYRRLVEEVKTRLGVTTADDLFRVVTPMKQALGNQIQIVRDAVKKYLPSIVRGG